MIASYLHNFIFIRPHKTASTTIEMTLAPSCGPQDILTPVGLREELQRGNGQPLCRNFANDPEDEQALREAILARDKKRRQHLMNTISFQFHNHMNARQIRKELPPAFWSGAFKFSAVRHPYEQIVSLAYFMYEPASESVTFEAYLDRMVTRKHRSNLEPQTINGEIVVNEFIRYESLHDDLKRIGGRIGIPIPETLPHAKGKKRRHDPRPAREILSEAQKDHIRKVCAPDFALFGYEP